MRIDNETCAPQIEVRLTLVLTRTRTHLSPLCAHHGHHRGREQTRLCGSQLSLCSARVRRFAQRRALTFEHNVDQDCHVPEGAFFARLVLRCHLRPRVSPMTDILLRLNDSCQNLLETRARTGVTNAST